MKSITKKISCRLCEKKKLIQSIDLGNSPLANQFLDIPIKNKTYPLKVMRCAYCNHLQLSHVVDKRKLFSKYLFVSSTSLTNLKHFQRYEWNAKGDLLKKNQ
jgi:hypothetical protein